LIGLWLDKWINVYFEDPVPNSHFIVMDVGVLWFVWPFRKKFAFGGWISSLNSIVECTRSRWTTNCETVLTAVY
jgi:hypothetical protein